MTSLIGGNVGAMDGQIVAIDAAGGAIVWDVTVGDPTGGVTVINDLDVTGRALRKDPSRSDRATGATIWSLGRPGVSATWPAVAERSDRFVARPGCYWTGRAGSRITLASSVDERRATTRPRESRPPGAVTCSLAAGAARRGRWARCPRSFARGTRRGADADQEPIEQRARQ